MKKLMVLGLLAALLTGCGPREFETVADSFLPPEAEHRQVSVKLPEDAAAPVSVTAGGDRFYACGGYTLEIQTLHSGSMDSTLRTVTGYDTEDLTVFQRQQGSLNRWDLVWSCAGEGGDQLCRAAVLDDGSCHYVLSVMAPSDRAEEYEEVWQRVFSSFSLA